MRLCHKKSISLLEKIVGELISMGSKRALDVAAGDGIATKDLLVNFFELVDCFDQCPYAVEKLEKMRESSE